MGTRYLYTPHMSLVDREAHTRFGDEDGVEALLAGVGHVYVGHPHPSSSNRFESCHSTH